jgi:hypothetical protein
MKNINFRVLLSAVCVVSILAGFTKVSAGPVRFDQVVQIVNAKPGKASTGMFSRLAVAGDYSSILVNDDDDDKKKKSQDGRVITETKSEITEDDTCDCIPEVEHHRGFPKWALLGLAAIPIAFILIKRKKDTPTPTTTPSIPITQTPTTTPTPTMTPTPTTTPTPPMTPTPTPPEAVPEPMTILLFGTGLASIGLAARRRFGKREDEGEKENE